LQLLELRLDNAIYRLGFAPSRKSARQLVNHRHFLVNGRIVDIPSFTLREGDIIRVRDRSKKLTIIHDSIRKVREGRLVPYFSLDKAKLEGKLEHIPQRSEIPANFREKLVIELYSK
jgi:small subunit ribosomal protein S4